MWQRGQNFYATSGVLTATLSGSAATASTIVRADPVNVLPYRVVAGMINVTGTMTAVAGAGNSATATIRAWMNGAVGPDSAKELFTAGSTAFYPVAGSSGMSVTAAATASSEVTNALTSGAVSVHMAGWAIPAMSLALDPVAGATITASCRWFGNWKV